MSDIFREVDEDLRRDRMEGLFKRYGGMAIGAALLIIGATAGYKVWQVQQDSRRQADTAALAGAISSVQAAPDKGVEALTAYAAKAPADMAAMARLNEAGVLSSQGKVPEAVTIYEAIATNGAVGQPYRELATVLSVLNQLDRGDAGVLQATLAPLTADASPWRFSAREMTAILAARAGDKERARTLFQQLAGDTSAPAGVRARAGDLAALYGKS